MRTLAMTSKGATHAVLRHQRGMKIELSRPLNGVEVDVFAAPLTFHERYPLQPKGGCSRRAEIFRGENSQGTLTDRQFIPELLQIGNGKHGTFSTSVKAV